MPKAAYHSFDPRYVEFFCPGCKHLHVVNVDQVDAIAPWGFNRDLENPTFTPSVLVTSGKYIKGHEKTEIDNPDSSICHSFVTAGFIQFLGDCTHELVNQTVELPRLIHSK